MQSFPDWLKIAVHSFWPLLAAGIEFTIPLTVVSFVFGLALGAFSALARMSTRLVLSGPVLCVDLPRNTAAGAAIRNFLWIAGRGNHTGSVSRRGGRVLRERRGIQLGNNSGRDPIRPPRSMGGSLCGRFIVVSHSASGGSAAGCPSRRSASVEFVHRAIEGYLACRDAYSPGIVPNCSENHRNDL